jgi:hypothetical protein
MFTFMALNKCSFIFEGAGRGDILTLKLHQLYYREGEVDSCFSMHIKYQSFKIKRFCTFIVPYFAYS